MTSHPAAERIPWHEALGRTHADTGRKITGIRCTYEHGPQVTCEDGDLSVQWIWMDVDADGIVPVEAQP